MLGVINVDEGHVCFVKNLPFMLSIVLLNDIMLSVVALLLILIFFLFQNKLSI
jgi:hypothetical protein